MIALAKENYEITDQEIENFQQEQEKLKLTKLKKEKTAKLVNEIYGEQISNKITDLAEQVEGKNVALNVNISKQRKRIETQNKFVTIFIENLNSLISIYKLTLNDVRLLLLILEKMDRGNQVNINQSALAKEMNVQRSNLNRNFKKLRSCQILIKDEFGNEFINYNLCFNIGTDKILENEELKEKLEISNENINEALTQSFKI